MRPVFYFMIISTIALCSCKPRNHESHKISITGKWHRFSMDNGYTEFDIDSQYVVFYNHKVGRFKLAYEIENDSFKYTTRGYAAKITYFGDSLFLSGNDHTVATLYRFNEPDIPFDSIPDERDTLSFETYIRGFDQRLIGELEKAGIQFFDPPQEKEDTIPEFQQLLNSKNK
ncbi:MAG: hypothetical protein JXB00_14490 [Bacteroidales bacterium]|nr:hypothetical protein [Bacteroidales bacterium]